MKIIKIESINRHRDDREDDMDLMNVLVEYAGGVTGNASMLRAHYDRIVYQEKMMTNYDISENEFNVLEDLFRSEFNTDHFYDDED